MKKLNKLFIITLILLIGVMGLVEGQNTAITDDNAYTAHSSAMLDVKSLTKGMLVPRMTSVQRDAIVLPATGLLIFDTNENVFYYYTGSTWSNLSVGQLWTKNGNYVYLSNTDDNVGIGVTTPENKLLVKADASTGIDESIFAVLNNVGDTVFAVYQEGVRIWVNDAGGAKANGSRGGFAVGGFNPAKAGLTNEYLRVTPDSVRIYIDDDFVGSKASGSRGGFAVGGFNPAKGTPTDNYLFVQDDSTRVYVDGDEGFAVDNIESGNEGRYMDLTPENYLIGHRAGDSITSAVYNTFIGYESGISDTSGSNNIFLGYRSGYSTKDGLNNIFIGNESGFSNVSGFDNVCLGNSSGFSIQNASHNVFLGNQTGISNTDGSNNVFIGNSAGAANLIGINNTFLGSQAGAGNTVGEANVFLGTDAGFMNDNGSRNIFIGYRSGYTMQGHSDLIFIGTDAGYSHQSGGGNTYIGNGAGFGGISVSENTFIGSGTGNSHTTGNFNTYIGFGAGEQNNMGNGNTYLGYYAGRQFDGDNNTLIGYDAGIAFSGIQNAMSIGNGAIVNASNKITLGNSLADLVQFAGYGPGSLSTDALGNIIIFSDKRLKIHQRNITNVLDRIVQLQGVVYKWKKKTGLDTENDYIGLYAQDVEKQFPELVGNMPNGYKTLNYNNLVPVLVEGIKEQQKEIEELKNQNITLKAEIEEIKQMINASAKK